MSRVEATMRLTLGVLLLSLQPPAPADAIHWHENEKHWKKHRNAHDDDERDVDHDAANCYFQPRDVRLTREYYEPRYRRLPPGLAKKFYRTGHLPPGWEKKMEPLPVAVERRLAPLPDGYRRGIIEGYAVVYSPNTRAIIDVAVLFGSR